MHRFDQAAAALCLLLAAAAAHAQITVSGSHLQDSTGAAVANATISFAPVSNAGVPISYRVSGSAPVACEGLDLESTPHDEAGR